MANLIIKPTSGGSLILQDEGGTAANTIDASGNSQLAGTLGVTGNATLSGTANNLGTTTGGTLSSGVTFPNGHIIKISTIAHTYTQVSVTSSGLADWSGMSVVITPSDATNKIIICGHMNCYGVAQNNINCVLFRDDGGGFDKLGGISDYFHHESGEGGSMPLSWIDTPGVTVATTYKIQVRSDNGGQCYLNVNDGSSAITNDESSNSWMYAMEVVA